MRIVLVGPPGAGKGTQGELLAATLGVPRVIVGDLLRAEVARGGELTNLIRSAVAAGELVSDHVVAGVVERALRPSTGGFVLDGFPRTPTQARSLDTFLRAHAASVDIALRFVLPEPELVARLAVRGRSDDGAEVGQARLALHARNEDAILEHYRGRVVELDAVGTVAEVHERALDGLREAALSLAG